MRLRIVLMLLGAVLVVATFTFPVWQPILQHRGPLPVNAFPGLAPQLQNAFLTLPQEQQHAYLAYDQLDPDKALAMVVSALAPRIPLSSDDQAMPALTSPVIVASGTFQQIDAIRWGQGTVTIYQDASNALTLRLDNFTMPNGADLHITLSAADTPKTPEDLSVGGVDPVDVGGLKTSVGAQNYQLPDGVDLTQFRSVVIYSTSLDLIYTYAPLFVRQ
jgi:hypothetical protein